MTAPGRHKIGPLGMTAPGHLGDNGSVFFILFVFLVVSCFLQVTHETSSSSFSLLSIVFYRWQIHGKQLPHKGRWKPRAGLQGNAPGPTLPAAQRRFMEENFQMSHGYLNEILTMTLRISW